MPGTPHPPASRSGIYRAPQLQQNLGPRWNYVSLFRRSGRRGRRNRSWRLFSGRRSTRSLRWQARSGIGLSLRLGCALLGKDEICAHRSKAQRDSPRQRSATQTHDPSALRFLRPILIDGPFVTKDSPSLCKVRKYCLTGRFAVRCNSAMNGNITPSVPKQTSRFAAAYRVLDGAIAGHAFPGCAFGVLSGGQVVLHDALGRFTYEESSPAVIAETVFDIASVTKVAATTAVAMILYQRGLLNLDTPLGDLLPAFVAGRPHTDPAHRVKLRHLLGPQLWPARLCRVLPHRRHCNGTHERLPRPPIEAEPGKRAEYSDPGFILLGKALEALIGETLQAWAQREIFHPLAMTSTCSPPASTIRSLIPPTEVDTTFRHRRIQGEVQDENAWLLNGAAGHAGLFSNVPDLLRFASEILSSRLEKVPAGEPKQPFRSSNYPTLCERQGPEGSSRALGWDTPSQNSSSGRHFSPAFHRASGLQRLFPMDRS